MEIRAMNNTANQNFGQLRISKGAEKALKEMSVEKLERLGKLGEEFKDYKHCHLVIGDYGKFIVDTKYADAYSNVTISPDTWGDKFVKLKGSWEGRGGFNLGQHIETCYEFGKETCKRLVEVFNDTTKDTLDKTAELVRAFEKKYKNRELEITAVNQTQKVVNEKADDLLAKFGIDA